MPNTLFLRLGLGLIGLIALPAGTLPVLAQSDPRGAEVVPAAAQQPVPEAVQRIDSTTQPLPLLIQPGLQVPDGGKFVSGIVVNPYVANPKMFISKNLGVTTYQFQHDGRPWKIVVNPDESMDITFVRQFDRDNLDQLRHSHPEIARRFEDFPQQLGEGTKVWLKLEIQSTISVMSASQLENLYPKLHQVYTQFVQRK